MQRDRCYYKLVVIYNQKILPWVISYICLYILSFVDFYTCDFMGLNIFFCNRIIFWQAKGIFRSILRTILFPFCWEQQLRQLWKSSCTTCTTWVVIKSSQCQFECQSFDQESLSLSKIILNIDEQKHSRLKLTWNKSWV